MILGAINARLPPLYDPDRHHGVRGPPNGYKRSRAQNAALPAYGVLAKAIRQGRRRMLSGTDTKWKAPSFGRTTRALDTYPQVPSSRRKSFPGANTFPQVAIPIVGVNAIERLKERVVIAVTLTPEQVTYLERAVYRPLFFSIIPLG